MYTQDVINIDDTELAEITLISILQYYEQSVQFEFSQTNDNQLTVGFTDIGSLQLWETVGRFSHGI